MDSEATRNWQEQGIPTLQVRAEGACPTLSKAKAQRSQSGPGEVSLQAAVDCQAQGFVYSYNDNNTIAAASRRKQAGGGWRRDSATGSTGASVCK